MREANFDSAIALANRMAPEIRAIPHILLLRDYYAADQPGRSAVLRDVGTRQRPGALTSALLAAYPLGDLETARRILDALPATGDHALGRAAMRAGLEVSYGRSAAAERYIAEMARLNSDAARLFRGSCALLPFVMFQDTDLRSIRAAFQQADSLGPAGADEYTQAVLPPAHRLYMLGALSARLGELDEARTYVARLQNASVPATWRSYVDALAASLRARIALAGNRPDDALQLLEQNPPVPIDVGGSPMDVDRFIRADLLLRAGRPDEALRWADNAFDNLGSFLLSPPYVYHAVRELLRAEAHEQRGDRDAAIAGYTRFLDLWRNAEPGYADVVKRAQQRRDALIMRRG